MPELPEVQTVVDDLHQAGLKGRTIRSVRVYWPKSIASADTIAFSRAIRNHSVTDITRRGKFIVIHLTGPRFMLIHLRMSGHLYFAPARRKRNAHEHVVWGFGDGQHLRFHDPRKFGRVYLTDNQQDILGRLGPEPFDRRLTAKALTKRLHARRRILKPLLLDQSFIAGLGNIYVDEALWGSGIHPTRSSDSLTIAEVQKLHRNIRRVLRQAIGNHGTSLGNGMSHFHSGAANWGRNHHKLKVFRRTGAPCKRCRTTIERIVVGQRSTHICPVCQPTPNTHKG